MPALSFLISDKKHKPILFLPLIAYTLVVFSFAVGVSVGQIMIGERQGEPMATVALKEGDHLLKNARIIRSGERGLLFYDTDARVVRFERWDGIKSVERSPR